MFVIFVLSVMLLPLLFTVGFNTLYDQEPLAELGPNISALAMLLGYFTAYACILYFARDYLKLSLANLNSRPALSQCFLAVFLGLLFTIAIALLMSIIPPPSDFHTASDDIIDGTVFSRAVLVIFIALLAPIIEEFVFRGYIFDGLQGSNSFATTAVASSLLFTIPHLADYYLYWPAVFVMFALGMLLAYFRKRNDSLLPCILLHASYNCGLLFLLYVSQMP